MKVEPELSKSDTFSSYLPSLLQAIAVQNGEFLGTPPITPPSTAIIPIRNRTCQFSPPEVYSAIECKFCIFICIVIFVLFKCMAIIFTMKLNMGQCRSTYTSKHGNRRYERAKLGKHK